jgi:pyruvate/2-oxoglutarate dehydrogenase complex dihydrolipoamide acyltransferase (E2) component
MSQDTVGKFEERRFPNARNATIDILALGSKRYHIPIMFEADVTVARQAMRDYKQSTGESLSFTGWIIRCLAVAVGENRHMHALRKGKKRLVIFEDVDVVIIVERLADGDAPGKTLPMPYIIRKANEKLLIEIHREIRLAQTTPVSQGDVQLGSSRTARQTDFFFTLPRFIRNLVFWGPLLRNPQRIKQTIGTVSVTAPGMIGGHGLSWGIPVGIHPLSVGVGGIADRPVLHEGQLSQHEFLGLTVLFDHEVTDGAPVARFIARFQELLEAGYELDQLQSQTN